jgi:hypothetical protein
MLRLEWRGQVTMQAAREHAPLQIRHAHVVPAIYAGTVPTIVSMAPHTVLRIQSIASECGTTNGTRDVNLIIHRFGFGNGANVACQNHLHGHDALPVGIR